MSFGLHIFTCPDRFPCKLYVCLFANFCHLCYVNIIIMLYKITYCPLPVYLYLIGLVCFALSAKLRTVFYAPHATFSSLLAHATMRVLPG